MTRHRPGACGKRGFKECADCAKPFYGAGVLCGTCKDRHRAAAKARAEVAK